MDPFWDNIYDDCKDKRYGTLFFATLLGVFGLLIVGMIVGALCEASDPEDLYICTLAGIVIVVVAIGWAWKKRKRMRKMEGPNYSTLSRDELLKARSKLTKQARPVMFRQVQRPARRAPPRAPDTNLKY